MSEITISTDKVCAFIEAARELGGHVPPTTGDDTTTGDDSALEGMEQDEDDDPTREEMVNFIAGLNVEEQIDLLALIYLGRGDYDIEEWDTAVSEASDRIEAGDPDYMIGNAMLPSFLEAGLEAFGRSCDDV